MKVSSLMKILSKQNPDDDVCALLWLKSDYADFVNVASVWQEVCDEFDDWEDACNQGSEWIIDAVIEKTESDEQ